MTDLLEKFRAGLAGRYDVERILGEGGMAVVLLATDVKHRRRSPSRSSAPTSLRVWEPTVSSMRSRRPPA
jgi:hypothetical protein